MIKYKLIGALTFCIFATAVIVACDKKVGKPVEKKPAGALNCDTITYNKYIKPIIDGNCTISGCHDGTSSLPLLGTYDQVKDRADAGRIKARVIDALPSPMPPSSMPPLTPAQKDLINCWLGNGKKQ